MEWPEGGWRWRWCGSLPDPVEGRGVGGGPSRGERGSDGRRPGGGRRGGQREAGCTEASGADVTADDEEEQEAAPPILGFFIFFEFLFFFGFLFSRAGDISTHT